MIKTAERTEIRPMIAEDMLWIVEHGIKEFGVKCKPTHEMVEVALNRERNGQCITGLVDGRIVGVGGLDEMWTGVGEVWMYLAHDTDAYPKLTYKIIRDGIKKLIEDNDFWRVQAWGRVDFDKAHTLFKHLGFKPEGIAKKYTPDKVDAILYAKVKDV
jgi:ribosomal protein S18 acetylase RimI-like enzyme